jgi:hypothetical protein
MCYFSEATAADNKFFSVYQGFRSFANCGTTDAFINYLRQRHSLPQKFLTICGRKKSVFIKA